MTTAELKALLVELAAAHKVPGAAVAVLDGDEVVEAAAGVINLDTGVEVTTDTLFQIGSITKVWTTTMVMQLVDEGKVELDRPVRGYVPELRFADAEATDTITVRQLLCHTSGVDGDHAPDTGRGDDCLAKFIETCATVAQITAPGALFSYNNVGFVVAGRLIEHAAGTTWDAALKERLVAPLGLERTVTLPEEAILHRAAVGHLDPTNAGELSRTTSWIWPRSIGPAGLVIATPREVFAFARLHLDGGVSAAGKRVLSAEAVEQMQHQQVECRNKADADAWGLGWAFHDWGGRTVIGHDGAGIGQLAFLRIAPDARFAVVLLTNGVTGGKLFAALFRRLFAEGPGIAFPEPPEVDEGVAVDPASYVGTYERASLRTQIEVDDGRLVASIDYGGPMEGLYTPVRRAPLRPVDESSFLVHLPDFDEDVPFVFSDIDESVRARYLHFWGRVNPRTS